MLKSFIKDCVKTSDLPTVIHANKIIDKYLAAGDRLTLRQLYYQFVSRNIFANEDKNYKMLGRVMKDARMAGLTDWNAIEDRTRGLRKQARWDSPEEMVEACAKQYHVDYWQDQANRVEVWIEKDALIGVVEKTCREFDCPVFSCRGYCCVTEMKEAVDRITRARAKGQGFVILYAGDHDPSGLDMGRYMRRSFREDFHVDITFRRIAITIDQIQRLNPPANIVKSTDSRAKNYIRRFGNHCWELDAIPPDRLQLIIINEIRREISNRDAFNTRRQQDFEGQDHLLMIANRFDEAMEFLESSDDSDDSEE